MRLEAEREARRRQRDTDSDFQIPIQIQYRDKFDSIRPVINYRTLVAFNWLEEGTVPHKKATDTLLLVNKLLNENKLERGDYLELSKLVYIYLMVETMINCEEISLAIVKHKYSNE